MDMCPLGLLPMIYDVHNLDHLLNVHEMAATSSDSISQTGCRAGSVWFSLVQSGSVFCQNISLGHYELYHGLKGVTVIPIFYNAHNLDHLLGVHEMDHTWSIK